MSMLRQPRVLAATVLLAAVAAMSLTGCTAGGSSAPGPSNAATRRPVAATTSAPATTFTATVGTQQASAGPVAAGGTLSIAASGVPVTSATVTDAQDRPVDGAVRDGAWVSAAAIPPHATWTWRAAAAGNATGSGTVTSGAAARVRGAHTNIGDGQSVGVAAPIIVTFDSPVTDKAAVERALTVTTPGHPGTVEGSWGWEGNSQVHFRTKEYWPADTKVHVDMPLATVDEGDGVYGAKDITLDFTIGRSQIVQADARSHQIKVVRSGAVVATYNASYGLDSDPARATRSGIHVVSEKHQTQHMVSQQWGYAEDEYWAVRISNNGEFIHANPATTGQQGNTNVSHGCINLSMADAEAYFQTAIYGDPVEVTGTDVPLTHDMSDIYDWALSWDQWQQRSALH